MEAVGNHMTNMGYAPKDDDCPFHNSDATKDPAIIKWEVTGELLYDDIDERMEVYLAEGEDQYGQKYAASAVYSCGELIRYDDIEQI